MPRNDATLPEPSQSERSAIDHARQQSTQRAPRVRVRCRTTPSGQVAEFGPLHSDHDGWLARLEIAFGTRGTDFALAQLNRFMAASRDRADGPVDEARLNAMIALVEGASPANEVEAALAVQMAITHHLAQCLLLRAQRADQIPQFESAANTAAKLLRAFTMQVGALAKLQRCGQQVIKVVHVHSGAQAIVGNVSTTHANDRGGVFDESGNQPHAKAELPTAWAQPMREVRSQDAARDGVPVASRER